MPASATDDRGSASLLALGVAFVLLGGCLVGVLWAAISLGRHRVDAAADLAALTAAQAVQVGSGVAAGGSAGVGTEVEAGPGAGTEVEAGLRLGVGDACAAAGRIAAAQHAELRGCQQVGETVTVEVAVKVRLGVIGTPVLIGQARAGPIEGADWPGDG